MRRLILTAAAVACLTATPALAAPKPVPDSGFSGRAAQAHYTAPEAAAFAKQIERDLAAKGARVAIVFRAGKPRDKLPEGIAYTHGAFWVYTDITDVDGKVYKGYVSYNLYQGDGTSRPADQSYLAQDFLLDFIAGNQVDDVGVIIPSPEMQRRILAVMASPTYDKLHVTSYSLISNPLNATHQNCTEFLLDVIASATWQTGDYPQIKADLTANFQPTIVRANIFERTFGPMVSPLLKMDDQSGQIRTTTYESIAGFMSDNKLLKENYVLSCGN
jgi:hypothetical protein